MEGYFAGMPFLSFMKGTNKEVFCAIKFKHHIPIADADTADIKYLIYGEGYLSGIRVRPP